MVQFAVRGIPVPQGSMRCLGGGSRRGHHQLVASNDQALAGWRGLVASRARAAADEQTDGLPLDGPLRCDLIFTLPRPASVQALRRPWPYVRPDLDKLVRAVCDGITEAGLWVDDSRVTVLHAHKVYEGDDVALPWPGVHVQVSPLTLF